MEWLFSLVGRGLMLLYVAIRYYSTTPREIRHLLTLFWPASRSTGSPLFLVAAK